MDDCRFERARQLVERVGEARLGTADVRTSLRLGQAVSLWDVVATYLMIYRFPLLFAPGGMAAALPLETRLRPLRGMAARLHDAIVRVPHRTVACSGWPAAPGAILFTGFVETFYRDVLRPVAERMAQRGRPIVVFRDHDVAPPAGQAVVATLHSVWDHWDTGVNTLASTLRRRLGGVTGRRNLGSFDWAGLADEFGGVSVQPDLRWLFWRELIRLIPYLAVATHLMARHRPALIVSADDADPRCRIFALAARAAGIPSLLVQQGLSRRNVPEFAFLAHDEIAVMGSASRDEIVAQGVSPERIVITGPPGFDEMAHDYGHEPGVRETLGVPGGHQMVLMASQPPIAVAFAKPAVRRDMIAALVSTTSAIPRVRLVIKPHPGEDVAELSRLVAGVPHVCLVDRAQSIAPLIRACDVFVTFFSTAALQAMYAGKPVINLDFAEDEGVRMFADSQATWIARTPADLANHLSALTSDRQAATTRAEAARRFLEPAIYRADGRAAERVADLAEQVLARAETATCN